MQPEPLLSEDAIDDAEVARTFSSLSYNSLQGTEEGGK